jgi:hypothetical protein
VRCTRPKIRLGRHAALKFLPDSVASEARALERFEREARAASSIDHPNICTLYEIGEQDGHTYMAMQLLDGQDLRMRIGGPPMPLDEILDLGMQIVGRRVAAPVDLEPATCRRLPSPVRHAFYGFRIRRHRQLRHGFGRNPIRASYTGAAVFGPGTRTANEWVNTAAFAAPAAYTFDAGRNSVYGPPLEPFDLAVMRNFRISEKATFQFRGEAFNAFNKVNLGTPNRYVNTPQSGTITMPIKPGRVIQIGARLSF